jgi:tripeptide aminopeptidase
VNAGTVELDTASSTHFRIEAAFVGFAAETSVITAAAEAIGALETGGGEDRASIRVEAIDDGGSLGAVQGPASLITEVWSPSGERAEALVAEVIDCLHDAANRPECTSDVDISVQRAAGLAR